MKIKEILKQANKKLIENKIEDHGIISRVLLQYVTKLNRTKMILNQEKEIEDMQKKEYEKLLDKIVNGVPLQYITNTQEFYGIDFYVDENVLIPQPDTEILVEEVLKIGKSENKKDILDLCTGSGCIGISIAKNLESVKVTLSDVSIKALNVAKKNAINNNILEKTKLVKSNLFENIKEKFDIIVSNPPYIETETIKTLSMQVQNEPILALDGGKDGLEFYKKIINQAPKYLRKNGALCIEIGYNQKEKVINLAKKCEVYTKIQSVKDLSRK